jgi:serine/threonine-protein kinase
MDTVSQLGVALSGRYAVERQVGAGGMAIVYLARDIRHERRVALKVLKPELGAVLGVERFLSEIRVTANLQHPNLLPLFDSGEAEGLLFYVMPYVDGESLRQRLEREKQLPIEEAVQIAVAVAYALEYAHQHGVIHRDLKPENILLQAGQPVISDFGIALAVSNAGGARITQTGLSLGTPQYMSPEQATGDRMVDARSDIYSLGAMMYEMLTGEPPHTGTTAQAVIARVLTETARSVRSSRPNVPEHIAVAVERALEKLPADRWASAREFADALQGKAVTAWYPLDTPVRQVKRRWQSELRSPLALGLGVIALTAAGFAVREWRVADRSMRKSAVRFSIAPTPQVNVATNTGQSLAITPDGETIVFIGSTAGDLINRLFVRSLADIDVREVPGTRGGGGAGPFVSPAGDWLGFLATAKLFKVSLTAGEVVPIADLGGVPTGMAWMTKDLIVVAKANDLYTVPASGGALTRLPRADGTMAETARQWPTSLGDGDHMVYASWTTGGLDHVRLAVTSLSSGRSQLLPLKAVCPLGVLDDALLYVTAGQMLMAVPFDSHALRVTGTPVPLVSDVRLGGRGACKAALATNGTLVFERGSSKAQMILRDAHGAEKPILSELRQYGYPRFSPNGKRIAVSIVSGARSDVWIYDVTATTLTRLTSDSGLINERPEWSPDSKRVLFRSDRGRRNGIWWQPADRSGPAEALTVMDSVDIYEAVLSPDGRTIVYQVDNVGEDVFYRRLSGDSIPRPVANTPAQEAYARVSPDGHWVAYVTDGSGVDRQVVVQPFPGPGAQVQVSVTGGVEPVWSPVGHRLFYRGDGGKFVVASWEATPTFHVVSRESLFDDVYLNATSPHANYDVSPDGTQLLLLRTAESPQVTVVYSLREELRARMSARPHD